MAVFFEIGRLIRARKTSREKTNPPWTHCLSWGPVDGYSQWRDECVLETFWIRTSDFGEVKCFLVMLAT